MYDYKLHVCLSLPQVIWYVNMPHCINFNTGHYHKFTGTKILNSKIANIPTVHGLIN